MLNIRPYNNKEQLLFPASIGDFIAKDDLVHIVDEADEAEDKKYGPDKGGDELPEDIRDKEQRIKKIRQFAEELNRAREKLQEQQIGKEKINLTAERL